MAPRLKKADADLIDSIFTNDPTANIEEVADMIGCHRKTVTERRRKLLVRLRTGIDPRRRPGPRPTRPKAQKLSLFSSSRLPDLSSFSLPTLSTPSSQYLSPYMTQKMSASNPPRRDPRIEAYLSKNKEWASSPEYKAPVPFLEMQRRGREMERGTVIVVACTDPRTTPEEFLGMDSGSKAAVIRTAGGRIHPALSTLYVLAAVGNEGKKGLIIVVHHTDCGLCHTSDEDIKESLRRRLAGEGEEIEAVERMGFGSIVDPELTVKEDVEFLRATPLFSGTQIVGLVQDTETGVLKEVL